MTRMTRTLADMTPAERADCVGRWCEHKHPLYIGMEVIVRVDATGANTYSPRNGWEFLIGDAMLGNLTPRLDLPRAWTPTGEPVPGEWEERTDQDGIGDCVWFTRHRRFVTEWEVAP